MGAPARSTLTLATLSVCLALGLAQGARAQISGAVGIQSDYRFRGISLTDRQPVVTLDLAYDHPSGLYAGATAIGEDQGGLRPLGFIEYAGYATPKAGGVSLDLGVNNQNLSEYADKVYPLNYSELYVGVVGSHVSAHIYYSPNYFRPGVNTLYLSVDGAMKPAEAWRLFAHLGSTQPVGDTTGRHPRYDLRAGVARQFGPLELQASVTATTPAPPPRTPPERAALMIGASWSF